MSDFVGLHVHSEHSHLDGLSRTDQIAKRAKDIGQSAVAITDHGEVGGHMEFAKSCAKEGIKPIFGMEGYHVPSLDKKKEVKNSHITLLAANNQGLRDLWAWSSIAYEDKYRHNKPLADPDLMREYGKNIYASDGCLLTDLGRAVEAKDEDAARSYVGTLLDIFGDRFFMELHTFQIIEPNNDHDKALNQEMTNLNQVKVRLANELGVPLVVVNDAHYAPPEDWENHRLVWATNTKGKVDQQDSRSQAADWMMNDEELIFWMSNHGISRSITEEAIRNTKAIGEACNAEITTRLEMPRITGSDHEDLVLFLDNVEKGFRDKVEKAGLPRDVYYARMEEEMRLIVSKGFQGYFNIVADLCQAVKTGRYADYVAGAKPGGLLCGPGRGSAGGSLVAYLLGITVIDPLKYDLLFERFLTPGRKGFPDIDVDVSQEHRGNVKEYLASRHGHDHVCGIGTKSRSGAKQALQDVARAMNIPYGDSKEISGIIEEVESLVEEGETLDIDEVMSRKGGDMKAWVEKYPKLFERVFDMQGTIRQSGTHAAGILIASKPILGNLPTRIKKGTRATQFDMWEVEELGALKLDALGIRHLDTLMVARELILERHGVWIDYEHFPVENFRDPAIWPQIDRGETLGIFQLETPGGTRAAKDFKPRSEVDIADLASVNRPGVIDAGLLPVYLKRHAGKEKPEYDHPMMEKIVGNTYGILVYQEQMLRASQELAGFTADQADDMRKYIGKKQMDKLVAMEGDFIAGCLANDEFLLGVPSETGAAEAVVRGREIAAKIWTSIAAAGRYSFNKSHAIGYAMIATWEIWTKHYYPEEFLVGLMQTDSERINLYIRDARRRGIKILPPDVNMSKDKFTIVGDEIRYGLDTVRGIGPAAIKEILKAQPFKDFGDYIERTTGRGANKKTVIQALIKIGAFDSVSTILGSVGVIRKSLMETYYGEVILSKTAPNKVASMDLDEQIEHVSLWLEKHKDDEDFDIEWGVPDFDDPDVISQIEKELVGNYITRDPMEKYAEIIDRACISSPEEYKDFKRGKPFIVGGQLTKVKAHKTKKGDPMAFLTISWNDQDFDVMAFPEAWKLFRPLLIEGSPVACKVIKLDRNSCHIKTMQRLDQLA